MKVLEDSRGSGDAGAAGGDPGGAATAASLVLAGRFRVERRLGRGAIGEVWAVEDRLLGEPRAVKVLRPELAGDREALERFRREVRLAARVTHPSVCRVFDLVSHPTATAPEVVFMTLERIYGPSLGEHLERSSPGGLPLAEVRRIGRDVAAGLAAAHAAGVVHRDLKSTNVLLEEAAAGRRPRAVLTDFGLARAATRHLGTKVGTITGAGELTGSPAYMAPEQVRGEPATPASDLYALGVLLFEMLTGELPFVGESAFQGAVARLHRPPPAPGRLRPGLPAAWDELVLRCLAPEPAGRYSDAGAVAAALGSAPVDETPRRRSPAPEEGPARRRWRRLALPLASGVALVTLAAVAGPPAAPVHRTDVVAVAPLPATPGAPASTASAAERVRTSGDELLRAGDAAGALDRFRRAVRLARAAGEAARVPSHLGAEALALGRLGHLEQAERAARESLGLFRLADDPRGVAVMLNNLAVILVRQGRLVETERLYREAAELQRRRGQPIGEAAALNNLGEVLLDQVQLAAAADAFDRALALRRRAGDRRGEGVTELSLARLAVATGETDRAVAHLRRAHEHFVALGAADGVAEALQAEGELLVATDELGAARRLLEDAAERWREIGDPVRRADVRRALAELALAEGRPAAAATEARGGALALHEPFAPEALARTLLALARAEQAAGHSAAARRALSSPAVERRRREDRWFRLEVEIADAAVAAAEAADRSAARRRLAATLDEAARLGLAPVAAAAGSLLETLEGAAATEAVAGPAAQRGRKARASIR